MKILQATIILLIVSGCADSNSNPVWKEKANGADNAIIKTSIDGAWELVWAEYNDTVSNVSKTPMLKMFHDGVFSIIARDSSGKIRFAGFGDYELSANNTYKETFRYHTNAQYIGAMDWQNYEFNGDTLYFKGFSKVIVDGKDVTNGWTRIEEKRVRVKW